MRARQLALLVRGGTCIRVTGMHTWSAGARGCSCILYVKLHARSGAYSCRSSPAAALGRPSCPSLPLQPVAELCVCLVLLGLRLLLFCHAKWAICSLSGPCSLPHSTEHPTMRAVQVARLATVAAGHLGGRCSPCAAAGVWCGAWVVFRVVWLWWRLASAD